MKTLLERIAYFDQFLAVIHKFLALRQVNQENLPLGCNNGHPMAAGPEPQICRSIGAIYRNCPAVVSYNSSSCEYDRSIFNDLRWQCNFPTVEEMIKSLIISRLANSGSPCYVNSILLAQIWNYIKSQTFNIAI